MKRFLTILTALCLVLSCGTAAFATIEVNGEFQLSGEQTIPNEQCNPNVIEHVSANESGDNLTVNGNVTGAGPAAMGNVSSVDASGGATITVNGEGEGPAVIESSNADAITAQNNGTNVTVEGDVTEDGAGNAVLAWGEGTKVDVTGNVTEDEAGNAVNAYDKATVSVEGDVTEKEAGDAIFALDATVSVGGDVIESGDGRAVYSKGEGTTVTVGGDVTGNGAGPAIAAEFGATVEVGGDVTSNSHYAVSATGGGTTVMVGGDVTRLDDGSVVMLEEDAIAIIEGTVTGKLSLDGDQSSSQVYIGQLTGSFVQSMSNDVHYLINTDTGSATLDQFSLSGDTSVLASGTVDGVNRTGYRYTTTGDTAVLGGKSLILKPTDSSKKLSVSGLGAGADVTLITNGDGSVTITLGNNFAGGLQSLMLILENIAQDNPGVAADIIAHIDYSVIPEVFVDPSFTVATATVELPEGAEEGAVVPLDIPNHAGIKIGASLLSKTAENHFVQLFLNGEPVPEDAYTVTANRDGSVSVLLSNTYLLALGNGTHSFSVLADGTEIRFSALVAK